MKRKILSLVALVALIGSLSSCVVRDDRYHHDRGYDRDHHYDNHYNNHY